VVAATLTNDRLGERIFVGPHNRAVTLRPSQLADDPAGLAFREPILLPSARHCLPAPFPTIIDLRASAQDRPSHPGLDRYNTPKTRRRNCRAPTTMSMLRTANQTTEKIAELLTQ
jgi:hypothetical protein